MKIGINAWLWLAPVVTDNLINLIPRVAQMGFDWIEIPLESPDNLDYDRIAETIREHELGCSVCVAMTPDRDLIHPNESIRDNGIAYIEHCIDAAQLMGSSRVIGPIYSAVGRLWYQNADERAKDLELLVEQLKSLANYASDKGITLCIEPLNRFETSFMNESAQVVELVDHVDSPNCKILLDTFHMNIEEKSIGDAIRHAGSRLEHIHACANDRGAPGSGNINWKEIGQALRDINYDDAIVIESFHRDNETMARAAAIWRMNAPSADELAQSGLGFLHRL